MLSPSPSPFLKFSRRKSSWGKSPCLCDVSCKTPLSQHPMPLKAQQPFSMRDTEALELWRPHVAQMTMWDASRHPSALCSLVSLCNLMREKMWFGDRLMGNESMWERKSKSKVEVFTFLVGEIVTINSKRHFGPSWTNIGNWTNWTPIHSLLPHKLISLKHRLNHTHPLLMHLQRLPVPSRWNPYLSAWHSLHRQVQPPLPACLHHDSSSFPSHHHTGATVGCSLSPQPVHFMPSDLGYGTPSP